VTCSFPKDARVIMWLTGLEEAQLAADAVAERLRLRARAES
jgi:hypothetical protein